MNAEQVVRNFLTASESDNPSASVVYLAHDMMFSGGMLEQPSGAWEVGQIGRALREAFSDFSWNVQNIRTQGSQVTVKLAWGGTHDGLLKLGNFVGVYDAPAVLPTGKEIRVPETFVFTVYGRKIVGIRIVSTPNGGYVSLLRQVGENAKVRAFDEMSAIARLAFARVISMN